MVLFQLSPKDLLIVRKYHERVMENKLSSKKSDVLSASEIGTYQYCSYAWWLQRCGYKPESLLLEQGKHAHITLGNIIDNFEVKLQYSRWLLYIGLLMLCVALLLFFLG